MKGYVENRLTTLEDLIYQFAIRITNTIHSTIQLLSRKKYVFPR